MSAPRIEAAASAIALVGLTAAIITGAPHVLIPTLGFLLISALPTSLATRKEARHDD